MPDIDIRIPWLPGQRLGEAYTRIVQSIDDWVLILDSDVLVCLTNSWYDKCLEAIRRVGYSAGWISCLTNRIGCGLQKHMEYFGDDLDGHREIAERLSAERSGEIRDVTDEPGKLSGFFILSHKAALSSILPFPSKFLGLDNWIYDRLKERGYRAYVMQDLYVYHAYKRLWKGTPQ